MATKTWTYVNENDEECRIALPAQWKICSYCNGDGHHCRHLGAYGREEFDREFSPEEQEAYFRGDYDKTCETCGGTGKVLVVDLELLRQRSPTVASLWEEEQRAEAAYQATVRSELRYIYGITY